MFPSLGNKIALSEQVENELTQAIRNGNYLPGGKLPTENELSQMFNVSRTSIREAVKKMSAKGLVEVRRGSGVYVQEISIKNTSEILNMFFELSTDEDIISQTINARLILEPSLAANAAKNRNENQLEILQKNFEELINCQLSEKDKEAEIDNNFHRTILSISNNKVLTLLVSPIFNLMPKFKAVVYAKPRDGDMQREKEIMLAHHKNILEAIQHKDENAAKIAMQKHILETKTNYSKSIKLK
ncbi:FadR family transcriptional regulator [Maribacter litopenaei]|uniref:FadR family transcriptional regulator n=1 Tax=Maribacter litopenaei TaxID=2976127 RepID=A0ABY5YCS9_9FLAO|nr:FadR/GntR family transcriptional regulator [Maribacter litopenaei]UWX56235.1 FadR family transcriptional regulator [Maribacter litopenaei]